MLGDKVVLPSRGVTIPNLVGGEVEVLPMKTSQEELLAGRFDMVPILNQLINSCVPTVSKNNVNPLDLLSGDRLFLLFMIRKFTYGSSYGFRLKCPSCGMSFRKEINIPDDLEINYLEEGDAPPYSVKLSNNKDKIGFRLLTGNDEVEIERYKNQVFKKSSIKVGDPSYIYTIARHIVSINGKEVDLRESKGFVQDMIGMDSVILQNAIQDKEPGVSRNLDFECPNPQCGFDIETTMPYSAEFFRPKYGGRR